MNTRPRRRASPMAVGMSPQALQLHRQPQEDEEEDAERARTENERRAGLYSRSAVRRLPAVNLPPQDARARKDLQLLLRRQVQEEFAGNNIGNNGGSSSSSRFEREQQDAKHREAAGWRPPMDRVLELRGLRATVPKDLRASDSGGGNQSAHVDDWKPGSGGRNAASGSVATRAGVDGVFQPPEGAAQVYAQTRHRLALPSALLAYPPRPPAPRTDAFDALEPHEAEGEAESKPAWCPASYATLGRSSSASNQQQTQQQLLADADAASSPSRRQRFPLRSSASTPVLTTTKRETQQGEERCASRQRALLAKAADAYARLKHRVDRHKQPAKRYALPVEDQTQHPRAYRLGLDPVPSSSTPSRCDERHEPDPNASPQSKHARAKLEFRPKSAGCLSGFQPSNNSVLKGGVAKVAGAKRRPRSASITYLGRATVYCMAPSSPSEASGFGGELADERRRRREDREQVMQALAARGVFHGLALAQVFARLRREALGSAAASSRQRRLAASSPSPPPCAPTADASKAEMKRAAALEQLSLDEFMESCALPLDEKGEKDEDEAGESCSGSSSIEAARESLAVSRAQFLAALEAFHHAVGERDANALFSVVDADVRDRARVCALVRAVASLQREHERLRRARVQL